MNSHKTAIARKKASLPCRIIAKKGLIKGRALDFGCGRSPDADQFGMEKYDPTFHPTIPRGKYNTVLCTYVLCTISQAEASQVLAEINDLLTDDGVAYISVRRGIKFGVREKAKTLQRKVILPFKEIYENKYLAIYMMSKENILFKNEKEFFYEYIPEYENYIITNFGE